MDPFINWDQEPLILTNTDIARLVRKRLSTVQADAWRAPWRLPPRMDIPGTAGVRYDRETVRRWFESRATGQPQPRRRTPDGPPLGRPPGTTIPELRARREDEQRRGGER